MFPDADMHTNVEIYLVLKLTKLVCCIHIARLWEAPLEVVLFKQYDTKILFPIQYTR